MMEVIRKIKDKKTQRRDLFIDDLSTQFEHETLSKEEQEVIVFDLVRLLKNEDDDSVIESIFNLLYIAFSSGICITLIVEASAGMLGRLKPGSLIHALPIISESDLPNKEALLEQYLDSDNPAIKGIAQE